MSNTQRWSYATVTVKPSRFFSLYPSDADLTDTLSRQGALGWELVTAIRQQTRPVVQLLFKRPL